MKVALVQPPLSNEQRYGTRARSGEMNPPLGLACLAASARRAGHEVEIVDAALEGWDAQTAADALIRRQADVVGFTAVTASVMAADEIAQKLKAGRHPPLTIVGGPHASAIPGLTLERCAHLDVAVVGEGERTLCEILDAVKGNRDVAGTPGAVVRRNGEVIVGPRRERMADLDELPMPAWDLLPDLARYGVSAIHSTGGGRGMNLVTSRGCPGQCEFCSKSVFGSRRTSYSAGRIVSMVRELHARYGVGQVQFDDDDMTANRRRMLEICRLLQDQGPRVRWCCFGRVDRIDPETLTEMKAAGCWQIKFGIESGCQEMLDRMGKGVTLEQIRRAVDLCRQARITATGHFIIGYPGETVETAKQTIRFATKLRLGEFFMTYMTPFPGTAIWERAAELGDYDPDWRAHSGWRIVFVPHSMSRRNLVRMRNHAYRRFYFRPRVLWGFLRRIGGLRQLWLTMRGFLFFLCLLRMRERDNRAAPER